MRLQAMPRPLHRLTALAATASLLLAPVFAPLAAAAQSPQPVDLPSPSAYPLDVDRGSVALWQSLRKLHTRASLILVVAHPDDEDGGMLTYEGRDQGVDTTLLTLTRGEGGQNVMSGDFWDQLGQVRTQELLAATNAFGARLRFSSVADYGFSKSLDEAIKLWGHDRVLGDVVRTIRQTRPLVITAVFAGNVSDGHGQHQVSGEMAQEAFNAAADPKMFPEQIKEGLLPWAPLKVYGRTPFARVTERGIFDSATGEWKPARYMNYTNKTWIEGVPPVTIQIPESTYNPLFGRSYFTLAREGLAEQKSQNGGIAIPAVRPVTSDYHLYASRLSSQPTHETSYFDGIDTSLAAIASYAPTADQAQWKKRLNDLNATVESAIAGFDALHPDVIAPKLAQGLTQTNALISDIAASKLPAEAKYNMTHELLLKQKQFNDALGQSLGLSLLATVAPTGRGGGGGGPFGDNLGTPTSQTVIPGQKFSVNLHIANQNGQPVTIASSKLISHAGDGWTFAPVEQEKPADGATPRRGGAGRQVPAGSAPTTPAPAASAPAPAPDTPALSKLGPEKLTPGNAVDQTIAVTVPANPEITRPYFSRPNLEQPYYDVSNPAYEGLPTTPYPLTAEVAYTFEGVTAMLNGTVQTVHRYVGPGPVLEPLLVAPAISVTVSPYAGIVPLSNESFNLHVTVRSSVKGPAKGNLHLALPEGWHALPESAPFATASDGDEEVISFEVTPSSVKPQPYTITAVADFNGQQFRQGFETTGYVGIRPYPYYREAAYRTSGVDVKIAPGLKVGYVSGTGDDVARSLQDLGVNVTFLSPQEIASGNLSSYDAIILGIRAYAARPELKTSNNRLLDYVKNGGNIIVQYQSGEYDHNFGPYPLTLGGAERVVEEDGEAQITAPSDAVLSWPNKITNADFGNWVEERGHGFLESWDSHYIAPTEMHDQNQAPQKGGLVYTTYGKGTYTYLAFAFFRQMPDGVPGSFRIMANLLSIGKNPAVHAAAK
jgi:LmbE family N-acetylglucosaminyl deacetylase